MKMISFRRSGGISIRDCMYLRPGGMVRALLLCGLALMISVARLAAQDDQLNTIHVAPPTTATPSTAEPKGAEAPAATGPDALKIHPGSHIRMNVDMVLVPVTVT